MKDVGEAGRPRRRSGRVRPAGAVVDALLAARGPVSAGALTLVLLTVGVIGSLATVPGRARSSTPGSASTQMLSVVRVGSGSGNVSGGHGSISCGSICSASYRHDASVELVGTSSPGSVFLGWSGGGCSGTAPCVLDMTSATVVKARFDHTPRCWGAASRDPEHRCKNRALARLVVPTPSDALFIGGDPCSRVATDPVTVCSIGVDAAQARDTVALIGDSHAYAVQPAMQQAAAANHWSGYEMHHNGCPLSTADVLYADPSWVSGCRAWTSGVLQWLGTHPEVTTVVVTGDDRRGFASDPEIGFHQAWAALPSSVRRVFVIRDVPDAEVGASDCVQRAVDRHLDAGTHCAEPRSATLHYDAEAAAAASDQSGRVRLLDFTPFFCDSRRCFPVVGGVLVHKDLDHINDLFAVTLGRYLRRAINRAK